MRRFEAARKGGARLIDIGCMQINHYFHGRGFRSVEAMFDPRENVEYAAQFLKALRVQEGSWILAAARYHAGPDNNPAQKKICLSGHRQYGRYWVWRMDRERARLLPLEVSFLPILPDRAFRRGERFDGEKYNLNEKFTLTDY